MGGGATVALNLTDKQRLYLRRVARNCKEGRKDDLRTHPAVGQLERGQRVARSDTLVKLAGSLGIPYDELLDGPLWTPSIRTAGAMGIEPFGGERLQPAGSNRLPPLGGRRHLTAPLRIHAISA